MIQLSRLKVHRASLQTISLYPVIYPTDMLFSSLVSFAFCLVIFGFVFSKLKMYILIHIWLFGWVRGKKRLTWLIS